MKQTEILENLLNRAIAGINSKTIKNIPILSYQILMLLLNQ
jgi:hypothetical protein